MTCPPGFTVSGAACAKIQDTSLLTFVTTPLYIGIAGIVLIGLVIWAVK